MPEKPKRPDFEQDPLQEQVALGYFASLKHLIIEIENVVIDGGKPSIDLETPTVFKQQSVTQGKALKEAVDTLKENLGHLDQNDREAAENWLRVADLYLTDYQ